MAFGVRFVSDVLRIMRRAISRQNNNDPDSNDDMLKSYLNDFVSITMSNDLRLFEQTGTLSFLIDGTNPTGVYTFNELGADTDFVSITGEAFISLREPVGHSVSWNRITIFRDPGEFFTVWGINNEDILIRGYPTMMLFYGNQLTFRTIPQEDVVYQVNIYGYKKNNDYATEGDPAIQYDYWVRYLAYGAALNYCKDFHYSAEQKAEIMRDFSRERKLMLTHTHNEIKESRCLPRF